MVLTSSFITLLLFFSLQNFFSACLIWSDDLAIVSKETETNFIYYEKTFFNFCIGKNMNKKLCPEDLKEDPILYDAIINKIERYDSKL